jgi:hypothetical protein
MGKYLGKISFDIYSIWEEEGCCLVCWGKEWSLAIMSTTFWVWGKEKFLRLKDYCWGGVLSSPSWIHGQARGWTEQVDWLFHSLVGWNMVVPFVVPTFFSDMYSCILFCWIVLLYSD